MLTALGSYIETLKNLPKKELEVIEVHNDKIFKGLVIMYDVIMNSRYIIYNDGITYLLGSISANDTRIRDSRRLGDIPESIKEQF